MAITFVLHEATRTGAPRVGALIARELARSEAVRVIAMKDGPLEGWLRRTLGPLELVICRDQPFDHRLPFEDRLRLAREMLRGDPADLVYVNSLASSVFAFAAALEGRRTLVHVHEKTAEMDNLLRHAVTKLEVMRVADAAVLAADDIRGDLLDTFAALPPEVVNFGIAVEVDAILAAAEEAAPAPPLNARGGPLRRGERLLIGMSGHASGRKGADIFLEVAQALPDCDFLWVGPWTLSDAPENIAYQTFLRHAPPNFYLTGPVDNPFPYMRLMDLFFLSSREDPNPLVLAEAMVLKLPILCFSRATAVTDRLGRHAIVLYGDANATDAARALRACTAQAARRPAFRAVGEAFLDDYDLQAKMPKIRDLIARLRGEPPTRDAVAFVPADGAAKRDLGQGVVELTFS